MRSVRKLIALTIALVALAAPVASRADTPPQTVVSPPSGWLAQGSGAGGFAVTSGYAPAIIAVSLSGQIQYTNYDIQPHNFISTATTTDPANWDPRYCDKPTTWKQGDPLPSCALFQDWSPDTDPAGYRNILQSAPVLLQMPDGRPKLKVNTPYVFYCGIHPGMKGTLVAIPA